MSDIDHRSCAQVFARIDDWVDRELSPDDLLQVRRHLEICAMCAEEFRLEGDLLRTVRGKLRRIQVPPGFEARVLARLIEAGGAEPEGGSEPTG